MTDAESIVVAGSDLGEFLRSLAAAVRALPPDMATRLHAARCGYFDRYGFDGLYERMNGRTVAEILAGYRPEAPNVIAEGQVDGTAYRLTETRPADDASPAQD